MEGSSDPVAFVDTNLFLRYITDDVPEQADAVERLFRRAAAGELRLVTGAMTIAEIVWVLESFYELPRRAIRNAVKGIIGTPGITVEDHELLLQAIVWYEEKNVDFIDAYSAAWMAEQEIGMAYTFDVKHFDRFEHCEARVL